MKLIVVLGVPQDGTPVQVLGAEAEGTYSACPEMLNRRHGLAVASQHFASVLTVAIAIAPAAIQQLVSGNRESAVFPGELALLSR